MRSGSSDVCGSVWCSRQVAEEPPRHGLMRAPQRHTDGGGPPCARAAPLVSARAELQLQPGPVPRPLQPESPPDGGAQQEQRPRCVPHCPAGQRPVCLAPRFLRRLGRLTAAALPGLTLEAQCRLAGAAAALSRHGPAWGRWRRAGGGGLGGGWWLGVLLAASAGAMRRGMAPGALLAAPADLLPGAGPGVGNHPGANGAAYAPPAPAGRGGHGAGAATPRAGGAAPALPLLHLACAVAALLRRHRHAVRTRVLRARTLAHPLPRPLPSPLGSPLRALSAGRPATIATGRTAGGPRRLSPLVTRAWTDALLRALLPGLAALSNPQLLRLAHALRELLAGSSPSPAAHSGPTAQGLQARRPPLRQRALAGAVALYCRQRVALTCGGGSAGLAAGGAAEPEACDLTTAELLAATRGWGEGGGGARGGHGTARRGWRGARGRQVQA
jgi:hypothetical protein